jgi:ABC-type multidrug transport system fused ATPase/permease subunit
MVPAIIKALVVGKEVFDVIERVPLIRSPDISSEASKIISIEDGIKFENVSFRYPTAPVNSRDVLKKVSFIIKPYTSTAIVGPSGSGKSTIVQLLNRFYDPLKVEDDEGKVT